MPAIQGLPEKLVAAFAQKEVPAWVRGFRGPFEEASGPEALRRGLEEYISPGDDKVCLLRTAERYMDEHLSNIVVPQVKFSMGHREVRYVLILGDPDDAARIAADNPAKDPDTFPFEIGAIPMQPDVEKWQAQRRHVLGAFLPQTNLSKMVPVLQEGVSEVIERWDRLGVAEMHEELHHMTLDLFLRAMCGVCGVLPPDPEASAEIRKAFNLDRVTDMMENMRTMPQRFAFAQKVLEARTEAPGLLLQQIRDIEDEGQRIAEMISFLVAGHDTTAHALEWTLLELARRPALQEACRREAEGLLATAEAEGRSPSYEELPRFEVTTAVITEALRLWGPAWAVFGRRLTKEVTVKGRDGQDVTVPEGVSINFWYYGHHHSPRLWGRDACEFRPLERNFADAELQRGTSRTPCSGRYHPFSLPSRDCIGKNFSLMEMRLLLPQLLRRFSLSLAEPSASAVKDLVFGSGEAFFGAAGQPGPIKPLPRGELWLTFTPRPPAAKL